MSIGYFLHAQFLHSKMPVPPTLLTELQQQASAERLQRAMRYRQDDDKARCLLAERLLRQAFSKQGIAKSQQQMGKNEFGKPVLLSYKKSSETYSEKGAEQCADTAQQTCHFNVSHFNISHSGEWVVCALDNKPIGIDVEQMSKQRTLDIANNGGYDKLFTKMEKDYLTNSQNNHPKNNLSNNLHDTITERFYRLWTLKESYLKAIGTGLSQSLQSFSIEVINAHEARLWLADKLQTDWYFYSFKLDENHYCSICSQTPIKVEKFSFIGMDDI